MKNPERLLTQTEQLLFCECAKGIIEIFCRSHAWDLNLEGIDHSGTHPSIGAIITHAHMSGLADGIFHLEKWGLVSPIDPEKERESRYRLNFHKDEVVPGSLAISNLNLELFFEFLTAVDSVLGASGDELERYMSHEIKAKIQKVGLESGLLRFVEAPADVCTMLNYASTTHDDQDISGLYYWTSELIGNPYDLKKDRWLPDFNFHKERRDERKAKEIGD